MNAELLNFLGSVKPIDFVTVKDKLCAWRLFSSPPFPSQHIFSDILALGIVSKTVIGFFRFKCRSVLKPGEGPFLQGFPVQDK